MWLLARFGSQRQLLAFSALKMSLKVVSLSTSSDRLMAKTFWACESPMWRASWSLRLTTSVCCCGIRTWTLPATRTCAAVRCRWTTRNSPPQCRRFSPQLSVPCASTPSQRPLLSARMGICCAWSVDRARIDVRFAGSSTVSWDVY